MALVIPSTWKRLLDQDPIGRPVPDARPALIRPAKAEWEIRFPRLHDLLERPLQQSFAREPVVPVAKAFDPGRSCEGRLGDARFRESQVVKAQVRRDARLIMPAEQRSR